MPKEQIKKRITLSKRNSLEALSNPRHRGKHLVIVKNKIFTAKTGQEATRIFKEVIKKYPGEKPTIAYVPKEDMLILFCLNHGD